MGAVTTANWSLAEMEALVWSTAPEFTIVTLAPRPGDREAC